MYKIIPGGLPLIYLYSCHWHTALNQVGRKVLGASGEQLVYVDAISPGVRGVESFGMVVVAVMMNYMHIVLQSHIILYFKYSMYVYVLIYNIFKYKLYLCIMYTWVISFSVGTCVKIYNNRCLNRYCHCPAYIHVYIYTSCFTASSGYDMVKRTIASQVK